jgi:hypothetical protein
MSELDEGREYADRLIAAMKKHMAFLEEALGIKMTPMYKEDELTRSDLHSLEIIPSRLVFPSRTSASGWREDTLLFDTLEDLVTFLHRVELLCRIAQAQQRGE